MHHNSQRIKSKAEVGGYVDHDVLITKLPGKSPILPERCNVPLNQPSSRFLCTNTTSPIFRSSSISLWEGYVSTHRYLQ